MEKSCLPFLVILIAFSCQNEPQNSIPEITHATEKDFQEEERGSLQLADGFQLELWAPGNLLSNAVALSIDNQGIAYIAETSRRKSSDIDIRVHLDWVTEDLALTSIEDTKAFHLKKLDPTLSNENSWQEDFNEDGIIDWQDLTVQSEYIRRVWDSDGDGKADASNLFADGFNEMLNGVAAGILHHNNEIFLTSAPNVWKINDSDGDGDADKKEIISTGYGLHIGFAGHDMSGLTIGPDGKIYWSIGDLGVNVVDKNGKRWAYPHEGAVMRANPDGSDFEVFAHGLRNPQELAFDAFGNLFSVDNDGDHAGEKERYVHIIEGSDAGWRIYWQYGKYHLPNEAYKIWTDEKLHVPHFSGQAAYITPPLALAPNGPAGLVYNPGTCLSKEWEHHFFASYFTGSPSNSRIQAFKFKPKGASFELESEEDILVGIVPTGLAFGPDGALYANDWLPGYEKKPKGRIWKLEVEKDKEIKIETQQILKGGMLSKSKEDLKKLMEHADMRVRMAAQFELANRNASIDLLDILKESNNQFARLHGIWGLGQLFRKEQANPDILISFFQDKNEHIRAQIAKVLGEIKSKKAEPKLILQINDRSPTAQFYAVEALGKIGAKKAFNSLLSLLEITKDSDPHLRHAIIYAISKIADEDQLESLKNHPSHFVRIGATVALRHKKSPKVASYLKDENHLVAVEAARSIHDDNSIPAALIDLAKSLITTEILEEAYLRRAINANLRIGDLESAKRLIEYFTDPKAPIIFRKDAMWALGYWANPPELDRVEGRYRKLEGHKLEDAQNAITPLFNDLIQDSNKAIKLAGIELLGRLNIKIAEDQLFAIFQNPKSSNEVKKASLKSLHEIKSIHLKDAINLALSSKNVSLKEDAQMLLASSDLPEIEKIELFEKILRTGSLKAQQFSLAHLANYSNKKSKELLTSFFEKFLNQEAPKELELDIVEAIESSTFEDLKSKLSKYKSSQNSKDQLLLFQETLWGGNFRKGRLIFFNNSAAQCIRCHKVDGKGSDVGPDLTNIASKLSREELLLSMVAPNDRIAPGYGVVILKLKNNKEVSGTLIEEQEKKLVLKSKDEILEISKEEISNREDLPSGMFPIDELLSKREIRDLVAYLVELK